MTAHKSHYENVPFEVPENWEWTTLENICSKIGSGSTPRGSNYSYEGIPFFRSQNVHNNGLCYDDIKYIDDETHQCMISTEVHPGDVLLNITGGSLGRCAVVPSTFDIGNVSQHVCILRPILVISEYLHAFILSGHFHKNMKVSGSGREGLPKYNLEKMVFPLPPFDEQARIVNQVQNLMYLIDDINANRDLLEKNIYQYKQEVLDLAISGKLNTQLSTDIPALEILKAINPSYSATDNRHYENLPQNWEECALKDIVEIQNGYAFKSSLYSNDGVRVIRITNVQDGYIMDDSPKYYPLSHMDGLEDYMLKGNDLLMSLTGNVGRVAMMPAGLLPAALNQRVCCITPKSSEVCKEFLFYLLRTDSFITSCIESGKGVAQLNVSTEWLKSYRIALPPKDEQRRIVKAIQNIMTKIDKILADL